MDVLELGAKIKLDDAEFKKTLQEARKELIESATEIAKLDKNVYNAERTTVRMTRNLTDGMQIVSNVTVGTNGKIKSISNTYRDCAEDIIKESKKLEKQYKETSKSENKASKTAIDNSSKVSNAHKKASSSSFSFIASMKTLAYTIRATSIILKATTVVITAIVTVISDLVSLTNSYAKSQAKLNSVLVNQGIYSKEISASLYAQAESIRKATTYSTDAIMDVQATFVATNTLTLKEIERATKATLDVATAMGESASSSASKLAKALASPTSALSTLTEAGLKFTKVEREQIANLEKLGKSAEAREIIYQKVEKYKGIAENVASTDFSSVVKAFNSMKEFVATLVNNRTVIGEWFEFTSNFWDNITDSMKLSQVIARGWDMASATYFFDDYTEEMENATVDAIKSFQKIYGKYEDGMQFYYSDMIVSSRYGYVTALEDYISKQKAIVDEYYSGLKEYLEEHSEELLKVNDAIVGDDSLDTRINKFITENSSLTGVDDMYQYENTLISVQKLIEELEKNGKDYRSDVLRSIEQSLIDKIHPELKEAQRTIEKLVKDSADVGLENKFASMSAEARNAYIEIAEIENTISSIDELLSKQEDLQLTEANITSLNNAKEIYDYKKRMLEQSLLEDKTLTDFLDKNSNLSNTYKEQQDLLVKQTAQGYLKQLEALEQMEESGAYMTDEEIKRYNTLLANKEVLNDIATEELPKIEQYVSPLAKKFADIKAEIDMAGGRMNYLKDQTLMMAYESGLDFAAETLDTLGQSLVLGAQAWHDWGDSALGVIATLLKQVGALLMAMGTLEMFTKTGNKAYGAKLLAGASAAYVAAGASNAVASQSKKNGNNSSSSSNNGGVTIVQNISTIPMSATQLEQTARVNFNNAKWAE